MADARCAECGAAISLSEADTHGAQVQCPSCQTVMRVLRRPGTRLVHADLDPLRHALQAGQRREREIERELSRARASMGIGINGLGIGLLYVVAKVALAEQPLTKDLIVTALVIAAATGIALELANFLFLAKRRELGRISQELERVTAENRRLRSQLREAQRR
jgi:DNA-directed RNA polymerase subunit RPC12/RpoP